MGLRDSEIKAAREKLKSRYESLADKYSPSLFNHARVDERYMEALRKRLPLEHFLTTEIKILKDLEERAKEKFAPPVPQAPSKADLMLEEFSRRIQAWEPWPVSPWADDETQRLARAMLDYASDWAIPHSSSLPVGSQEARLAQEIHERALVWLEPVRGGGTRALEDLALNLGRETRGETARERLCKEYMKEIGFLVNLLYDLFTLLAESDHPRREDFLGSAEAAARIRYAFRLQEFRLSGY